MDFLSGKTWYVCGDSFTEGDYSGSREDNVFHDEPYMGKAKVYPYFIGRRTGMIVKNIAKCGMTMAKVEDPKRRCFSDSLYQTIGEDADYITLMFGINDWHQNVPIGNVDDEVNTTFCGAWNIVLTHLIFSHPFAKIGILITNGCNGAPEYPEATRVMARRYGLPFLDLDAGEQVPVVNRTNRSDVLPSIIAFRNKNFRVSDQNGHPGSKMHEYESTFIETWLRTL